MKTLQHVQLHLVNDRSRLSLCLLPVWVKQEIERRDLIIGKNDMISFCGLIANKNEVFVFMPRSVNLTCNHNPIALASLMANCVIRYEKQSKTRVKTDDIKEGSEGSGQLSVIHELLEDYRLNGLYVSIHRKNTVNQGRTDWKRTINRITPFPDKDDKPVYPILLGNRVRINHDNIITEIHASIIYKLDLMFGWWFSDHAQNSIYSSLGEISGLLERQVYCLSMLKKERASLYSDRNIRLINNLIKYLEMFATSIESPVVVGLRDFHWAWEHMLGTVLNGRTKLNEELPIPVYYSKDNGRIAAPGKSMRTDIILENKHNKKAVVIDAKYYAATNLNNSPGWPDLVKQFFYAKAILAIREDYQIKNVFIFPGEKQIMNHVSVESMDGTLHDKDFPPIICLYVNPLEVMKHYNLHEKMTLLSKQLFDAI
jgi:hypothetical protein